jgi:hypothetical protein
MTDKNKEPKRRFIKLLSNDGDLMLGLSIMILLCLFILPRTKETIICGLVFLVMAVVIAFSSES